MPRDPNALRSCARLSGFSVRRVEVVGLQQARHRDLVFIAGILVNRPRRA